MNLIELVTHLSGYEYTLKGSEYSGPCPFCQEGNDRFKIWLTGKIGQHYWCRVCGRSGGATKLVMELKGLSYYFAMDLLRELDYNIEDIITRETYINTPKYQTPHRQSECQVNLDFSTVALYHMNGRQKAIDYLAKWHISKNAVDKFMFGWNYEQDALTIPHFWLENDQYYVKGLKFRHMTSEKHKRFTQVKGGSLSGFWNTALISNPDGSRIGPMLDYLFILEAEKDAALLTDMGYNAVSYLRENRWNQYINVCLQNVALPVIVADFDEGRQGMLSALQIQSFVKTHTIIVSTDKLYIKSPSDLAQRDGIEAVHEWVRKLQLGIEINESI